MFWHQKMDFDYCGDFSLLLYAFAFSNAELLDVVDDTMRPIDRINQGKMLKMQSMSHTANRTCVWNISKFFFSRYFGILNRLSIESICFFCLWMVYFYLQRSVSMARFRNIDMTIMPKPLPATVKTSTNSRFFLKYWAIMTIEQSLVMPTPKPTTIPNGISLY